MLPPSGTPSESPENYKLASPVTFVSKDDPPVLTLHGDKDGLVPVQQAELLDEKMKAVEAKHTLVVFKDQDQGHGLQGGSAVQAIKPMRDFFDKHLKP